MEMMTPEVINPDNCNRTMVLMDIHMLQYFHARERTETDFRELGLAAGFSQVNVVCQMHSVGTIFEMLKTRPSQAADAAPILAWFGCNSGQEMEGRV